MNIVDVGETVINIQRFNSYKELVNVTAIILKIGKLRSFKTKEITSEDIRYAETYWGEECYEIDWGST